MAKRMSVMGYRSALAILVLASLTALALASPALAEESEDSPAASAPRIPFVVASHCPFECCRFGKWICSTEFMAYASAGDTTQVAFRINPGETSVAKTGILIVDRFGSVVLGQPVKEFAPGDTVLVLYSLQEGGCAVWGKGVFSEIEEVWPVGNGEPTDKGEETKAFAGRMIASPKVTWWVWVQNANGRGGWLRLVNHAASGWDFRAEIKGMDDCS